MSLRNRVVAAVGGVGITLAVAVTAVTAGGIGGGSAAPAPVASSAAPVFAGGDGGTLAFPAGTGLFDASAFAGPGMGDPAQCQDVQNKLAANLGVPTAQLQAALKKTALQEIDEAGAAGKLTATQAQAARDRINNSTDLCTGFGFGAIGGGGKGHGQGAVGGARGIVDSGTYQAVATYFGISTDQLKADLQSAGTLQGVARKYNKDTAADKAKLQAAIETALRADLAKRGVAQAQIDQIVAQFKANFDTFYTAPLGHGMPIAPGGGQTRPGRPAATPSARPSGTQ